MQHVIVLRFLAGEQFARHEVTADHNHLNSMDGSERSGKCLAMNQRKVRIYVQQEYSTGCTTDETCMSDQAWD